MTRTSEMTTSSTETEPEYRTVSTTTETSTEEYTGTWSWIGEDKENDIADKQRVAFYFATIKEDYEEKETEVTTDLDANDGFDYTDNNSDTYSYTSDDTQTDLEPDMILNISQLRNDEMIAEMENYELESTYVSSNSNTFGGSTFTSSSTTTSKSSGMMSVTFTQE